MLNLKEKIKNFASIFTNSLSDSENYKKVRIVALSDTHDFHN
jgi:hypothetical protein